MTNKEIENQINKNHLLKTGQYCYFCPYCQIIANVDSSCILCNRTKKIALKGINRHYEHVDLTFPKKYHRIDHVAERLYADKDYFDTNGDLLIKLQLEEYESILINNKWVLKNRYMNYNTEELDELKENIKDLETKIKKLKKGE